MLKRIILLKVETSLESPVCGAGMIQGTLVYTSPSFLRIFCTRNTSSRMTTLSLLLMFLWSLFMCWSWSLAAKDKGLFVAVHVSPVRASRESSISYYKARQLGCLGHRRICLNSFRCVRSYAMYRWVDRDLHATRPSTPAQMTRSNITCEITSMVPTTRFACHCKCLHDGKCSYRSRTSLHGSLAQIPGDPDIGLHPGRHRVSRALNVLHCQRF